MKRKGITLDQLNPKYRAEAEKQLQQSSKNALKTSPIVPATGFLADSGTNTPPEGSKVRKRGKKRREMNQTEREFFSYLKRGHKFGDTARYEPITLRWGEGAGLLSYTPDFLVEDTFYQDNGSAYVRHIFFEVKGAHAWKQDIVKFKAARAEFENYEFQLWEKDADGKWHNTI